MRAMHFPMILVLAFFVLAGARAVPAHAQDNVSVRAGQHADYTRIVFEWPQKPAYSLSKQEDKLIIRFARAGILDDPAVAAGNVKKLETISSAGEPLQVAVTIPSSSRFRDFIVQNRVVLDVYDPKGAAQKAQAPPEPEADAPKQEPKLVEKERELTQAPAPKDESKSDFSVERTDNAVQAPVGAVETTKMAAPAAGEMTVTFGGTFSIGVAAFIRGDHLWIVTDNADAPNAPVLTRAGEERGTRLEKMPIEGGAAYRTKIPPGLNACGAGGGLSWKITLSEKECEAKPVSPRVDNDDGEAALVWPMAGMRKILNFTDPIVGDDITAITTGRSENFAGAARRFVPFDLFESPIGIAYAAKADNVKASVNPQAVRIYRDGGLAVSGADYTVDTVPAPEDKKDLSLTEEPPEPSLPQEQEETDAAETAEEPSQSADDIVSAAGEKPSGNNIYNFPAWEMGGLQALHGNMHAMMTQISAKSDGARDEDLITLAKINIANKRGAEALGLLRIVLQRVPDLDNNAEFQALRGAAFALAGKYDEAIIDYSRAAVKDFDDVKLWRTYTLAGLEDWKQATAEMPANISAIASYPKPVRVPVELALAEVALRAGSVPLAQGILDIVERELPTLPLHLSSAWSYLAGEADRQAGRTDAAIAHWEPLVENGKDDLFRAKAELSLTKLLLDTKKITPAEAIDKLEGLRYAWRGDELETLINYRLGEVYVDNGDYLKGLTVLRNATTLSPGAEIGAEVKASLANGFRDIFVNNRLKDMPPMEAISLYEEFKDLTPPGDAGDRFVESLAERLVQDELMGRAASLLEHHVNNRLKGVRKGEVAIRLAAIRLLDGNPDGALRSLQIAETALNAAQADGADEGAGVNMVEKNRQIKLLRARALSMQKKPEEAITILNNMRPDADVSRLRADIAWTAGKWDEAASALGDLIITEDISARRPLTDYQREIIFNRGIALNLAGDRVALANLRERYNAQMGGTPRGQMFEIVTRARRPDMIGSREAIESMMSEIDLFQGFLDGYSRMDAPPEEAGSPAATTPDATDAPEAAAPESPAAAQAQ